MRYAGEAQRRGLDTARGRDAALGGAEGRADAADQRARGERGLSAARQRARLGRAVRRAARSRRDVPAPGEVWPDSRLLAALDARVGDVLTVGAAQLRVTRVLISRPDQGSGFVDLAPSLLMNEADLPATQLIQPGSRVRYAVLFAGDRDAIAAFRRVARGEQARRPSGCATSPRRVRRSATPARAPRASCQLASLVSVLLCAVAIAMTARRYVQRHLDIVALMKTLGATQSVVLSVSLSQLICIALVATAARRADRLRRAGLAARGAEGPDRRRAAAAELAARGAGVRDGAAAAGRLRAAVDAAAVARAGDPRAAPRHRAAAHGARCSRSGRRCWRWRC